jgi:hypothetical protein
MFNYRVYLGSVKPVDVFTLREALLIVWYALMKDVPANRVHVYSCSTGKAVL